MRFLPAACIAALLPFAAGAQTLYKCVLNGKTVYQGERCPEDATQKTLEAPKPGPTRSAAAQAAEDTEEGLNVVSGYRACTDGIPEWGPANKSGYDAWRAGHAQLASRIESDPELQRRYREKMQANRYGTPEFCAKIAAMIRPEQPTPSKAK
jgi:hypothetical protein